MVEIKLHLRIAQNSQHRKSEWRPTLSLSSSSSLHNSFSSLQSSSALSLSSQEQLLVADIFHLQLNPLKSHSCEVVTTFCGHEHIPEQSKLPPRHSPTVTPLLHPQHSFLTTLIVEIYFTSCSCDQRLDRRKEVSPGKQG